MDLRETLSLLQSRQGRPFYRFVWTFLVGPVLFYFLVGPWYTAALGLGSMFLRFLVTNLLNALVAVYFAPSAGFLLPLFALAGIPIGLVLSPFFWLQLLSYELIIALWVVVFLRLREKPEHAATLVALVRFWTEHRRYGTPAGDIVHDGFTWTVKVPLDQPVAQPRTVYPGIKATIPPRCPKCDLPLTEEPFKGGFYWICKVCNTRRINRLSYFQAAFDIEKLSEKAWRALGNQYLEPAVPSTGSN